MRQLNNNLAKLKNVNKPRSIADEYLDYGSNLYGPQSRFGHHPRNSNFTRYITDYEARLDALHKSGPSWKNLSLMTKLRPKIDEPKTNAIEFSRGFWDEKNLQKIYHSLKVCLHVNKILFNMITITFVFNIRLCVLNQTFTRKLRNV